MKFNEKLIELRKKAGLSQEELGYKLNVTRQTVSKWELAQTTPEMDKLVEMSKIFNVSVDDLLNEREVIQNENPIIENQPIIDGGKKAININNKIILIIVAIIIVILVFVGYSKHKKQQQVVEGIIETEQNIFDKFFSLFDKAEEQTDKTNDLFNNVLDQTTDIINGMVDENTETTNNIVNNMTDIFNKTENQISLQTFNGTLELYKGSNSGSSLKRLFDEIITSNKKEDKLIVVKYAQIETQDTEEINNLKLSIKDSNNFAVSFDYDEKGYINKVTIQKVVSEFEIKSFNNSIEIYAGSNIGGMVISVLDNIVTSNKTEDRKITVNIMR